MIPNDLTERLWQNVSAKIEYKIIVSQLED